MLTVAGFARFAVANPVMDVLAKRFRIGFVAIGTLFVRVLVLGTFDHRQFDAQLGQFRLAKGVIGSRPTGAGVRIEPPQVRQDEGARRDGEAAQC